MAGIFPTPSMLRWKRAVGLEGNEEAALVPGIGSRWVTHGIEALAFARQAALMHRDCRFVVPQQAQEGDDIVVLLHGLFATAGVLRPLRAQIEAETGFHTATFTYAPGPGVSRVAWSLASLVSQLPREARLHLVGHSMGGVIARYFVQELGGDARVAQTISLGSPFGGTAHARLLPASAGRDIVPDSDLLRRLRERASLVGVPHLSISGADDRVVTEACHLPGAGEHVVLPNCGHNSLLFDRRAARLVIQRVRSEAPLKETEAYAGHSAA